MGGIKTRPMVHLSAHCCIQVKRKFGRMYMANVTINCILVNKSKIYFLCAVTLTIGDKKLFSKQLSIQKLNYLLLVNFSFNTKLPGERLLPDAGFLSPVPLLFLPKRN